MEAIHTQVHLCGGERPRMSECRNEIVGYKAKAILLSVIIAKLRIQI